MPDAEASDATRMPTAAASSAIWRSGIQSWFDTGLIGELRDRSAIARATPPADGAPFICQDGRFRSLHFSTLHLQSEMDVRKPLRLTVDYTRMMMGFLLFHPAPARIEMIGLGGGSLAKSCHHLLPASDIDVVEIDPRVIALRDHFLIPPEGDQFAVILGDGADFVREDISHPDILLVDGFDRFGQSARLCSAEFYSDCRKKLAPGGIMVVNLSGDPRDKALYAKRISDAFGGRVLGVAAEGGANRVVFAWKGRKTRLTPAKLMATLVRFGLDERSFLGSVGRRLLRQIRRTEARRGISPVVTDDRCFHILPVPGVDMHPGDDRP